MAETFEKITAKKHTFFMFLRGLYLLMGGPIDINFDVFGETSVGFLKRAVLQFFPKYSSSYVNLTFKSRGGLF